MTNRMKLNFLITMVFVLVINLIGGYILNHILLKSLLLTMIVVTYMVIVEIIGLLIWTRFLIKRNGRD